LNERLIPQLKLAKDRGFDLAVTNQFLKKVSEIVPDEAPALVHGDLWNGNYLTDETGAPVLIDPAVAYASRETDLAMMQLFGGFPAEVYKMYDEIFPMKPNWKERLPLWQLYYLLVHLNLFGRGYLAQVTSIIKRFS
jgi:fructosamine-3-kinase